MRTKALRCLSAVVEADPGVLARADIEMAVRSRLMDISTSVREAAVDLLGRFLICRPELTQQYYSMLSERIRDKGVSVRKRVIRILRDICVEQTEFPRIAEICVMIIRRVNDEESVKVSHILIYLLVVFAFSSIVRRNFACFFTETRK